MNHFNLKHFPLWTALVTPMLQDGSVDYPSLKKLIQEQEAANNGIVILGSTGEALNLDLEEKKKIIDFCSEQELKVPLMAGVGGINLKETLEWCSFLEKKRVDCYLLVTPLYSKPGTQGQIHWFKSLLDHVTRPCMLYNIPSRAGKALDHQAVRQLKGHKNFWAIKEASGSVNEFCQYLADVKETSIQVYSGDDGMLPLFFPHGCVGVVSVASNLWPRPFHQWVEKVLSNQATLKEMAAWEKACNALFIASNPIPAKVLLHELKRMTTPVLRPPLTHLEIENKAPLLEANRWVEQQN